MKIGFIAPPLAVSDGWALYSRGVIESIAAQPGNQVLVLTSYKSEPTLKQITSFYPLLPDEISFGLFDQLKVLYYLLKYFRGCEVIHACYEKPMIGAAVACQILGSKLVLTLHGTYALPPTGYRPKKFIKRMLMRFAYGTSAITTTGSFNTEQVVRAIAPELPECRFIPNGVDSNTFFQKSAVSHPTQTILSVGWLKDRKGFDTVIDALGLIKNKFPLVCYKIIGGDTDTPDSGYYKILEEKIKTNHLKGRVEIRLGKINRQNLADEYNNCKLFILVSRNTGGHFEGFPMVYMEALACGVPVITTRGYGSEYAIKDGYNGFLVNQDDPVGVAEAIKKVFSDEHHYQEMKKNALQVASENSWQLIVVQLIKLYEDALNK